MKETELTKNDIEFVVKQQKQKEYKKLGSIQKKIDGSKVFCIDKKTGSILEAKYENDPVFKIGSANSSKLHIEKGKIYVESINKKNAVKRAKSGKILFHT